MPLLEGTQRTVAWMAARRGKVTASVAAACLGLDPYMGPITAFKEILGRRTRTENRNMRWGREQEPRALAAYEVHSGYLVETTGFWLHSTFPWLGASPDGLVEHGVLELKCPNVLPAEIPPHHAIQMRVAMACTDAFWADYFAWTQEDVFCQRIERDLSIENDLVARLHDFYLAYVQPDIAPPRRKKHDHKTSPHVPGSATGDPA